MLNVESIAGLMYLGKKKVIKIVLCILDNKYINTLY